MKNPFLCAAGLLLPLATLATPPVERLELRTLHLQPASDISSTYVAVCNGQQYALLSLLSPASRRATSVTARIGQGADIRQVDVTGSGLGQLMSDPTGFGELGFGCGRDSMYVRYVGATRSDPTAAAVVQEALFRISTDGVVSPVPLPGITLTLSR